MTKSIVPIGIRDEIDRLIRQEQPNANVAVLENTQSCARRPSLLRRTRFDELPELYNILVSEMSFMGPRPLLPVDQPEGDRSRLLVRPGLTGWAQVNGGRDISVADKTALNV